MKIPFCDLNRQHRPIAFEINTAIAEVLASGVFLNGEKVTQFEEAWAKYCGMDYCIACASGTDALQFAAIAEDAKWAIAGNGCPFTRKALMRSKQLTLKVLDVDLFGVVEFDVDILDVLLHGRYLSSRSNDPSDVSVVVDACQAHGWKPPEHVTAAFSFYPTKNLGGIGDSGAVVTNGLINARAIRESAAKWHSRMSEINAAVLLEKLPHLDLWNAQRAAIAEVYYNELGSLDDLKSISFATRPGEPANHHIFAILCHNKSRGPLSDMLKRHGIETKVHYPEPLAAGLPGCKKWCDSVLSLPCYPGLRPDEIQYICDCIQNFYR